MTKNGGATYQGKNLMVIGIALANSTAPVRREGGNVPIKPENRHNYRGVGWRILREAILSRAENGCECVGECGRSHSHKEIWEKGDLVGWCCGKKNGESYGATKIKVVLTIAHLCHRPACKKPAHLKAMCQGCHLRYDRFERAHGREKK